MTSFPWTAYTDKTYWHSSQWKALMEKKAFPGICKAALLCGYVGEQKYNEDELKSVGFSNDTKSN